MVERGSERYRLFSPTILPYHISVSEWTAKKAAILGAIFSGTSVVFLFATAVAMNWQHRSGGQKDWGMVFGVAFGVPFVCCSVAALLSFFVSVSLIAYKRFFGLRQALPVALTAVSEPPRRRVRHPAIITFAGFAVLIASAKFGAAALFLVGIPAMLVASAVAPRGKIMSAVSRPHAEDGNCEMDHSIRSRFRTRSNMFGRREEREASPIH